MSLRPVPLRLEDGESGSGLFCRTMVRRVNLVMFIYPFRTTRFVHVL